MKHIALSSLSVLILIGCGNNNVEKNYSSKTSGEDSTSLSLINGTPDAAANSVVELGGGVLQSTCTATRIGPRHFLSAAHCLTSPNAKSVAISYGLNGISPEEQLSVSIIGSQSQQSPKASCGTTVTNGIRSCSVANDQWIITTSESLRVGSVTSQIKESDILFSKVSSSPIATSSSIKSGSPIRLTGYGCYNDKTKVKEDHVKRSGNTSVLLNSGGVLALAQSGLYVAGLGTYIPLFGNLAAGCSGDSGGPAMLGSSVVGVISNGAVISTLVAGFDSSSLTWAQKSLATPSLDRIVLTYSAGQSFTGDPTVNAEKVELGKDFYLYGYKLVGSKLKFPGGKEVLLSAANLVRKNASETEVVKVTVPAEVPMGLGKVTVSYTHPTFGSLVSNDMPIDIKASSGAQMNYTKYLVMKAGYPSTDPAGLCAGAYRQNIPASQVATYSLVELLEIKSGPDAGRKYRTETEDHCTYNTVGPITVSQLSVVPTRFGAPIAQFTVQYTLIYSPEFGYNPADSPTVTQGASLFKEYTMRSDGRCDIRSFNAGYLRSVSQSTDTQYTDTTVYEITGGTLSSSYLQLNLHEGEQPAVDSCNDERITRLKSPANERVQVN